MARRKVEKTWTNIGKVMKKKIWKIQEKQKNEQNTIENIIDENI